MTELDSEQVSLRTETQDDKAFLLQLYISTRQAELIQTGWGKVEMHAFPAQQFAAGTFLTGSYTLMLNTN